MAKFSPQTLDRWFPLDRQYQYVERLKTQVGFTRRRAECFVRLWGYLFLKQQFSLGKPLAPPVDRLSLPDGFVSCTHREAADLFYADRDRGSPRAAGMTIDKLAALGYLEKQFDGNTICLRIRSVPQPENLAAASESLDFFLDAFDPRTDAIPVASFLARNYNWMSNGNMAFIPHRIARLLRGWAKRYPQGMRVLRRSDNLNPIGFYLLYPTAATSEENLFLPPKKSMHLSSTQEIDPLEMALPGDESCMSVFVRSWAIDRPYLQPPQILQLLEDSQQVLGQMQADFPNLCDLYALLFHPFYEKLTTVLGFQKTVCEPMSSVCWGYIAIDRFLALDISDAILDLDV
ncbi:MAG: hypothetical protein SWY16_15145 [Cyanobacteriota bacterium]|nr:hypothetical protein [Cyanobacteriota bacterium]